jgi:hypothetical protein
MSPNLSHPDDRLFVKSNPYTEGLTRAEWEVSPIILSLYSI